MINDHVQVKTFAIENELFHKETIVLRYKIEYPQLASVHFEKVSNKLNTYYKGKAYALQNYFMQKLYRQAVIQYEQAVHHDFPFHTFEAQENFLITLNQNCAFSLYFDQYQYTGGAHGTTVRYSDTWNMQNGCKESLRNMFVSGTDYKKYIIDSIYRQIEKEIAHGENPYFDDYKENVVKSFNSRSFYLTPNGIVIYYQQYDIAPYASGIREFTIPYEQGVTVYPQCI